jgi:hypothetical protein
MGWRLASLVLNLAIKWSYHLHARAALHQGKEPAPLIKQEAGRAPKMSSATNTPYFKTSEHYEYGFESAAAMTEYLCSCCQVREDALRLADPTDFTNKIL